MNTNTVAVSAVVIQECSAKGLAGLIASFREHLSKAASQTKDQSYYDYLETMAVLTGF